MKILQKTSLYSALSSLGRSVETPQGIFYWSARAKNEADIDGTIGIAQDDDGTISHLPCAETWVGSRMMERLPKAKIFAYAPIPGVLSLRQKWLSKILEKHPACAPFATLPVVTNGTTHSLAIAGHLLLERGQTLITAEKSWENYEHIFTGVQGIKIAEFPLFGARAALNIDGLIEQCRVTAQNQNKVVLLLNFPHNQTGFMPSHAEAKKLGVHIIQLCKGMPKIPFVILLDDAYEGYVYDNNGQKYSILSEIFSQLPNLTVAKMDGISKVMLAYGYRVGFLTFFINSLSGMSFDEKTKKMLNAEVESKVGGLIRGEISQVNHHGQILADALMDNFALIEKEKASVITQLAERYKTLIASLGECYKKYGRAALFADPCNGGFFCYVNCAKELDPKDIAQRLLKEYKVGIVPAGHGLRVAFAGVNKNKIPDLVEALFKVTKSVTVI